MFITCLFIIIIYSIVKMPGCAAIGCSNSYKKGFLMKNFPKEPARRKLWLSKMKRDNWVINNYSCLCEVCGG